MSKTVIIDLDGTLIDGNSFTMYVKYCFTHMTVSSIRIAGVVLLRKLRLISHFKAKQRIMRITAPRLTNTQLSRFLVKLNSHVRPMFATLLHRKDGTFYLATAAPREYAEPFAHMLGFDAVVATDCDSDSDCRGYEKVERLLELGVTFDENVTVYTDHEDDRPLMSMNAKGVTWLVAGDGKLLECE
jgi:phosphoserine phosphatase